MDKHKTILHDIMNRDTAILYINGEFYKDITNLAKTEVVGGNIDINIENKEKVKLYSDNKDKVDIVGVAKHICGCAFDGLL